MNKVTVFDYEEFIKYKMNWDKDKALIEELKTKYRPFRNRKAIRCAMGTYRIISSEQGLEITDRFIKEVQDTDENGYSIERGIEWLRGNNAYNDMIIDFFGVKDYDIKRSDWLFTALEEQMQMFINRDDEEVLTWIKDYCLLDIEEWKEFLKDKEYEVDL